MNKKFGDEVKRRDPLRAIRERTADRLRGGDSLSRWAREIQQAAIDKVLADEAKRPRQFNQTSSLRPRPKKLSCHDILLAASEQRLTERYRLDPKGTERNQFRACARLGGISVKRFRKVRSVLAILQLEELITRGTLTLPRIGRFRIVESPERLRLVNVAGKIGRDGRLGLRRFRRFARVKFWPSASLVRALRIGADLDLVNDPELSCPHRRPRRWGQDT